MINITVVLKDSTLLIKHTQGRESQTPNYAIYTKENGRAKGRNSYLYFNDGKLRHRTSVQSRVNAYRSHNIYLKF